MRNIIRLHFSVAKLRNVPGINEYTCRYIRQLTNECIRDRRTSKFHTHDALFPLLHSPVMPFWTRKKTSARRHPPTSTVPVLLRSRSPPQPTLHRLPPARQLRRAARRRLCRPGFAPPHVALAPPRPSRVGTSTDTGPSPPPLGVGPPATDADLPSTAAGHRSHQRFFFHVFEVVLNVIQFRGNLRFNLSEIDLDWLC
jgi:hypothetical protein